MMNVFLSNQDDVLRWMMNVFGRGVGWGGSGVMTYVVICKQR